MDDIFMDFIVSASDSIGALVLMVLSYPILSSQRIFWLYILTSIVFAFYVYYSNKRSDPDHRPSIRAFIRFLLPKEIWRSSSAWLDVRYFFFHQVFRLLIYGTFLVSVLNFVFEALAVVPDLKGASELTKSPTLFGAMISFVYMFCLIMFGDFVSYCMHYLQHKVPFLWEFHKVHHSLEVMHPLSNYREHPIDNIVYAVSTGAATGLIMALANNLFGYVPTMPQLLGVPLLMFAFNFLGYNLRHSHVWLRWPGKMSIVFGSPAHHHIHHSCHPDHIDKNFAFIFPIWDVLFRTFHLPETNKDVRFGVSIGYVNEFKTCLGIYFIPFKNLMSLVSKGLKGAFKNR